VGKLSHVYSNLFSAKWTIEELGKVMHMPSSALRRKITFWQSQGILREEATDTFTLLEEQKGRHHDIVVVEDDEIESAMASSQDQREEELQVNRAEINFLLIFPNSVHSEFFFFILTNSEWR
jgi:hypothetical protein